MRFLKQIQARFLSLILIACCLTFQADALPPIITNTHSSWVVSGSIFSLSHDVYNIKPKKAENIIGNNFSIFSFKCFINQSKSVFATNYIQQKKLQLPQTADYLKFTPISLYTEDDVFIG